MKQQYKENEIIISRKESEYLEEIARLKSGTASRSSAKHQDTDL
jgi:hypothetical protein